MTIKRPSTRQLLVKIPNYPCLYRHSVNETYYGIKKTGGKRKEHSLETADRKIAERKLKAWISNLDKTDSEAEKTTLKQLIDKFVLVRQGKSASTKVTEQGIINNLKADWNYGMNIRVSQIRPSMLEEWLDVQEPELKASSFNRYSLFLKQLFDLAVNDRIIAESPFYRLQRRWKKLEKPIRLIPSQEQFQSIIENIRNQKSNHEAEESANFIEFLGLAGLGQAEASSLEWGNVDWERNRLTVRRCKTKALFYVPIFDHLKPLLKRLYSVYAEPPPRETKVFGIQDARKALKNACTRLGYPNFTQRSLRAGLIVRLQRSGVDIKLISKWQGHNDGGRLILNTYTEIFSENDADYVRAELAKVK